MDNEERLGKLIQTMRPITNPYPHWQEAIDMKLDAQATSIEGYCRQVITYFSRPDYQNALALQMHKRYTVEENKTKFLITLFSKKTYFVKNISLLEKLRSIDSESIVYQSIKELLVEVQKISEDVIIKNVEIKLANFFIRFVEDYYSVTIIDKKLNSIDVDLLSAKLDEMIKTENDGILNNFLLSSPVANRLLPSIGLTDRWIFRKLVITCAVDLLRKYNFLPS